MRVATAFVACWGLLLPAAGCTPTQRRNPVLAEGKAPAPTLVTGAVNCLASLDVAAAGKRVRRAAGFGEQAIHRVDEQLERKGLRADALPSALCRDFIGPRPANPNDWLSPPAPAQLGEMLSLSGGRSLLAAAVSSEIRCFGDDRPWIWDEPQYENETGEIDCHETKLVLAAYLFGADGSLLWKSYLDREVHGPPALGELAQELLRGAPVDWHAKLAPPVPGPPAGGGGSGS